jgi:hypothetical protein
METFQKIETVEARKYEGPRITVVSDKFGEQVASSGDYLIGTKRGEVHVVPASTFEAEFKPYTDTPEAEQLVAAQSELEAAKGRIADLEGSNADLGVQVGNLGKQIEALSSEIADQTALKAELTAAAEQLSAEKAAREAAEQAQAEAEGHLKAIQEAQAVLKAETQL